MNYLNYYTTFEEAFREAYYRRGLEQYVFDKADLVLEKDYLNSTMSKSFEPIKFMEEKHISETDFSSEIKVRFLSETNTSFIYCFLFDTNETICRFVIQKAFDTLLNNAFFAGQQFSLSDIYDKTVFLPEPFRNAFFRSCVPSSALSEKLLTYLNVENKKAFIDLVYNETDIMIFDRTYPFLCLAAEFAEAMMNQPNYFPSLDKYIISGRYDLYARWSSSLYTYIVNDIKMGEGVKEISWTTLKEPIVQVDPKSPPTPPKVSNAANADRILYSTLNVNREMLFERLIKDNWVAQPDGPSDGIELIKKLKYFFYDNNDESIIPQDCHPIHIKWCKHPITLNFLIRLLYNRVGNVKKEDIFAKLGKYGGIDKKIVKDLDVGNDGCWNAVCNVFEKKNARKTTIDNKTKNTEKQINQIKEIVTLYYECRK